MGISTGIDGRTERCGALGRGDGGRLEIGSGARMLAGGSERLLGCDEGTPDC